jgi:hypothetical protein
MKISNMRNQKPTGIFLGFKHPSILLVIWKINCDELNLDISLRIPQNYLSF